jgi:DNA-directed RNA polymerase subunit RPC12/RpoP
VKKCLACGAESIEVKSYFCSTCGQKLREDIEDTSDPLIPEKFNQDTLLEQMKCVHEKYFDTNVSGGIWQCRKCGKKLSEGLTNPTSFESVKPVRGSKESKTLLLCSLAILVLIVGAVAFRHCSTNAGTNESKFITSADQKYLNADGGNYFISFGLTELNRGAGIGTGTDTNFKAMVDDIYRGVEHSINPPRKVRESDTLFSFGSGYSLWNISRHILSDEGAIQAFEDEFLANAARDEAAGKLSSNV